MTEKKNDVAIYEEIRKDLVITDGSEYKVPMAMVFGRGTLAKTESFGGRSLIENSEMVDKALMNTADLQNIWNHSHTQWTWRHINLSYHSPWKNMRQIAAEMASKRSALNEAKWRQIRNEIKIKKMEEQLNSGDLDYWKEVELKVKLAEMREGLAEGMSYIEGAMKDVLALNELYEQLKEQCNNFNEEDVEKEESRAHLKRSLVQCIRDVRQGGSITKGEQEYLEQIGVNPSKMQMLIRKYVQEEEQQTESWDTTGLYEFVDGVVSDLIDNMKVDVQRMAHMGFKPEYKEGISYDKKIAGILENKSEEE